MLTSNESNDLFFLFIIVSCFTLNSILNLDLRGLIYLVGLLLACFVATVVSKIGVAIKNSGIASDL